jgi:hypothetical protein
MQYGCMMPCNMSALYVLTKRKVAKYRWRMCSQWQFTLIPMVSSNETTYTIVVSVPAENTTDIYHIHHHLSPKWHPCI